MISESLVLTVFLLMIFNVFTYFVFRFFLYKKDNAGIKFLLVNMAKDLAWLIIALSLVEKTRFNMLVLMSFFLICSFAVYFAVIRMINKS